MPISPALLSFVGGCLEKWDMLQLSNKTHVWHVADTKVSFGWQTAINIERAIEATAKMPKQQWFVLDKS